MDRTFFAGVPFSAIFWQAMRLLFLDEQGRPGVLYRGLVYEQAKEIIARNGRRYGFNEGDERKMLLHGDFDYCDPFWNLTFEGPDPEDLERGVWGSAPVPGSVVKVNFYKLVETATQGLNNFPFQTDGVGVERLAYFTAAIVLHEIVHNHGFEHPKELNWEFGSDYASSLPHVAFLSVLMASPHASFFASEYEIGVPPGLGVCAQIGLTGKPFGSANIAAASWAPGRLDVFGRGQDRAIWHKSWEGDHWTDWHSVGGTLTSGPGTVSWGPGRIDVFARGLDGDLWHMTWEDQHWTEWHSLGGALT